MFYSFDSLELKKRFFFLLPFFQSKNLSILTNLWNRSSVSGLFVNLPMKRTVFVAACLIMKTNGLVTAGSGEKTSLGRSGMFRRTSYETAVTPWKTKFQFKMLSKLSILGKGRWHLIGTKNYILSKMGRERDWKERENRKEERAREQEERKSESKERENGKKEIDRTKTERTRRKR